MRKVSVYHKTLRSGAVLVALLLVFDSGIISNTTHELSYSAQRSLANVVGVGASVSPNEFNVITAELQKQRAELDQREREIDARAREGSTNDTTSTYILSAILFILLCLILMNYVLDFVRSRRIAPATATI
jgi:hypothetical protein